MNATLRVPILVVGLIVGLTLVFATATPAAAAPLRQAPTGGDLAYHTVQPGEWVYCIARGYGVSPDAILYRNGILNPNLIQPGWILAIPNVPAYIPPGPVCPPSGAAPGVPMPVPPRPPSTCCARTHYVLPGQTLYRIALTYGVSVQQIATCNGLVNPNYIRAYTTLCIPGY